MNQNRLLLIQFKHSLQARTTSGKKLCYCIQNKQWIIIGDWLPKKSPIELMDNSIPHTHPPDYFEAHIM